MPAGLKPKIVLNRQIGDGPLRSQRKEAEGDISLEGNRQSLANDTVIQIRDIVRPKTRDHHSNRRFGTALSAYTGLS